MGYVGRVGEKAAWIKWITWVYKIFLWVNKFLAWVQYNGRTWIIEDFHKYSYIPENVFSQKKKKSQQNISYLSTFPVVIIFKKYLFAIFPSNAF